MHLNQVIHCTHPHIQTVKFQFQAYFKKVLWNRGFCLCKSHAYTSIIIYCGSCCSLCLGMRLTCRHHTAPPSLPLSNLVTPFLASPEESVLKKEHRPVLVKKNDSVGFEYPRNFLPYKYYHRKGGESSRYRYRYKVVSGCCSNKNKNK